MSPKVSKGSKNPVKGAGKDPGKGAGKNPGKAFKRKLQAGKLQVLLKMSAKLEYNHGQDPDPAMPLLGRDGFAVDYRCVGPAGNGRLKFVPVGLADGELPFGLHDPRRRGYGRVEPLGVGLQVLELESGSEKYNGPSSAFPRSAATPAPSFTVKSVNTASTETDEWELKVSLVSARPFESVSTVRVMEDVFGVGGAAISTIPQRPADIPGAVLARFRLRELLVKRAWLEYVCSDHAKVLLDLPDEEDEEEGEGEEEDDEDEEDEDEEEPPVKKARGSGSGSGGGTAAAQEAAAQAAAAAKTAAKAAAEAAAAAKAAADAAEEAAAAAERAALASSAPGTSSSKAAAKGKAKK
eukprot:tig00000144_g9118.t2